MNVTEDISLMVIDRIVENSVHEINKLRVGFLQLLCLQTLYKEENKGIRMLLQWMPLKLLLMEQ